MQCETDMCNCIGAFPADIADGLQRRREAGPNVHNDVSLGQIHEQTTYAMVGTAIS